MEYFAVDDGDIVALACPQLMTNIRHIVLILTFYSVLSDSTRASYNNLVSIDDGIFADYDKVGSYCPFQSVFLTFCSTKEYLRLLPTFVTVVLFSEDIAK